MNVVLEMCVLPLEQFEIRNMLATIG